LSDEVAKEKFPVSGTGRRLRGTAVWHRSQSKSIEKIGKDIIIQYKQQHRSPEGEEKEKLRPHSEGVKKMGHRESRKESRGNQPEKKEFRRKKTNVPLSPALTKDWKAEIKKENETEWEGVCFTESGVKCTRAGGIFL